MAKRSVRTLKFFQGDIELEKVCFRDGAMRGLPLGKVPKPPDGRSKSDEAQFSFTQRLPASAWLLADREVRYLTKPDPHQCEWRCMDGEPGGECWCQCGGKSHSRSYRCEAA